jgi:O-methyltransferase domain/Dimerisation domain
MMSSLTEDVLTGGDTAPATALRRMLTGYLVSQSIYAVAQLGIADLLAGGAKDCDELAREARVAPGALGRVMRAAEGLGLFESDGRGRFGLTPMGQYLRGGVPGSLRALAVWNGEVGYRAWGEVLHAVRTGEPALAQTLGMPLFRFLSQDPTLARVFNEAMDGLAAAVAAAAVEAYDFGGFGQVVDIGGGHGRLVASILGACPGTRAVIFDTPEVVAGVTEKLESAGLAGRCEVVGGDFFESVPEGGDAYVLSSVLHDWDDERAVRVLRNCRRAMGAGARLLVVECVLESRGGSGFGDFLDLQMLVMTGGRERTRDEFASLLTSAGFLLKSVTPTSVPESVIEAAAV